MADVILYVYDSSDTNSFSHISNLRVRFSRVLFCHALPTVEIPQQKCSLDHIPTLFVATKSDLDLALQVRASSHYSTCNPVAGHVIDDRDTRCNLMSTAGDWVFRSPCL
jgi:Ras family protein T1